MNIKKIQWTLVLLLTLIVIPFLLTGFFLIFTFLVVFFEILSTDYPVVYSMIVFVLFVIVMTVTKLWKRTWLSNYSLIGRLVKKLGLRG